MCATESAQAQANGSEPDRSLRKFPMHIVANHQKKGLCLICAAELHTIGTGCGHHGGAEHQLGALGYDARQAKLQGI